MSHAHGGHDSCSIPFSTPICTFHLGFDSTRHDRRGRWLWRFVSRIGFDQLKALELTIEMNGTLDRSDFRAMLRKEWATAPIRFGVNLNSSLLKGMGLKRPKEFRTDASLAMATGAIDEGHVIIMRAELTQI